MKEKELQPVTFEQAKKLKTLGFDWKTCQFYSPTGLIRAAYDTPGNCNDDDCEISFDRRVKLYTGKEYVNEQMNGAQPSDFERREIGGTLYRVKKEDLLRT